MLWSSEQETKLLRSADNTIYLTQPSCPLKVLLQYPVDIYHNFIVLSREQDIKLSVPKKFTYETLWSCPLNVLQFWKSLFASQSLIVKSEDEETKKFPSGSKFTQFTGSILIWMYLYGLLEF